MSDRENYNEPSPIRIIDGLVTTERSGLGKWGEQSKNGLSRFCNILKKLLHKNFTMIEIGSYAGESTIEFAKIAGKVYAVDPWVNGYDPNDLSSSAFDMSIVEKSFNKRTEKYSNIRKLKMTSKTAEKWFKNEKVDIVYIDAIHKIAAVRDDINRWKRHINHFGFIAGHDFCGYWGEVVDAILETIGLPDYRTKDGSWMKLIERGIND